jgi:alpha-1,2-mannosyltransferase
MTATVDGRPHRSTAHRVLSRVDTGRIDRWTLVRIGTVAVAWLAAHWAIHRYGRFYNFFDMNIYHGAMVWWTSGGNLYDYVYPGTDLGFTYPPFAAVAMAPMALLPAISAGYVNTALSLAALVILLIWLLLPVADRNGWPRWFTIALAVPMAVATEPMRESLGFGQINILLAALIYADMVALRHRSRIAAGLAYRHAGLAGLWSSGMLAGAGVGLATAIKLTPALFIGYFMVTRQWRAALTSLLTALGVTMAGYLLAGQATAAYFTGALFDTGRIGQTDATANQSLAGILARLYNSPTTPTLMWFAFALVILVIGVSRAATAHREGDELVAFTLIGLTANIICPISWSHHLVFVVPALVVLLDSALRRRGSALALASRRLLTRTPAGIPALAGLGQLAFGAFVYVVYVSSPIWRYEHKLQDGVSHRSDGLLGVLGENSLGLLLIALLVLLPVRTGAEPAFYPESAPSRRAALLAQRTPTRSEQLRPR